eukprot:6202953-Pleurochrysis_carterae.AAC.4
MLHIAYVFTRRRGPREITARPVKSSSYRCARPPAHKQLAHTAYYAAATPSMSSEHGHLHLGGLCAWLRAAARARTGSRRGAKASGTAGWPIVRAARARSVVERVRIRSE